MSVDHDIVIMIFTCESDKLDFSRSYCCTHYGCALWRWLSV